MNAALILTDVVAPALDGQAHNHTQARLIFNSTPEVDSLAERVAALRDHGVPDHVISDLFADLRALRESNAAELACERRVAHVGDDLARTLNTTGLCHTLADHMTVTGIKRAVGGPDGPLAILADPAGRTAKDITDARAAVRAVVTRAPDTVLTRASLRNQLGASRHDLLLALRAKWGRGVNAS
jgi:hypothetical protein